MQKTGAHFDHLPDLARLDHLSDLLGGREKVHLRSNPHQLFGPAAAFFGNRVECLLVNTKRLFAHQVLASLENRGKHLLVHVVRQ